MKPLNDRVVFLGGEFVYLGFRIGFEFFRVNDTTIPDNVRTLCLLVSAPTISYISGQSGAGPTNVSGSITTVWP